MKRNELKAWLRQWDQGAIDFTEKTAGSAHRARPIIRRETEEWQTPVEKIRTRELDLFSRLYPVLACLLCLCMIAFLLLTVLELPAFGEADAPANNEVTQRYTEKGIEETGAVNVVAGVILDYRAFDTLGESHVLYTATSAVLILLLSAQEIIEPEEKKRIMQHDRILKNTARVLVPLVILYGIYVIFNGHLGPGGGFSGGAVIGGGLILYAIAFGFDNLERFLNMKSFRIIVLCALCFYSVAKCYSFFCGANGYETIFTTGTPGNIFSAGLILPLNIAVGVVVACTMYGFYSLFKRGRI